MRGGNSETFLRCFDEADKAGVAAYGLSVKGENAEVRWQLALTID
jgi:hypothetical protein